VVLGSLVLLAGWALDSRAQDSEQRSRLGAPVAQSAKSDTAEKKVAFEMRDKPWSSVLEWLSDQTGVPVITTIKPTGSFTFIAPRGHIEKYTIPEVIDILNEALSSQKELIIRRSQSLTIIPSDEKIDPAILPRILPEELSKHGNTELVSVVLPLTTLVAEDEAKEVKKMLGPFGDVVPMTRGNQLLITDTVGNIKRVQQTLAQDENSEKRQADTLTYVCKYVKAREAERILKELLPNPRDELQKLQPPAAPGFPGGGFGGRFGGQPQQQQPAQINVPASALRAHYIASDERTNTVLVTGPADVLAKARDFLKQIDTPQKGQEPIITGPSELKQYTVAMGTADAIAGTLKDIYKSSNSVRISAVGGNTILAYAGPEDQFEIAKHIVGAKEKSEPEVITLNALEAAKVLDTLKGMFGSDTKTGAPFLDSDNARNAIIVKGTADQVNDVKNAIKALGESGTADLSKMRVITIEKGSAAPVAAALQRMLQQIRDNPVNVNGTAAPEKKTEPRPARPGKETPGSNEEQEEPPVAGKQLIDPRQPATTQPKPGNKKAPINITAAGNKLIITSDDPEALKTAQQLVRLLTQSPGKDGEFEVIPLKNASATEAAKILDQAFNPPKEQQSPFPFFGPRFGQQPEKKEEERIRVVADPISNSLLIKASPIDMERIRKVLETSIDRPDTDSRAVAKTFILPLHFASANDIANVLRDVYREHINNNPLPGQGGRGGRFAFRFGGFGGGGGQNVDANGNPRGVDLSIGVDDRTNSLIVDCTEAMYQDVNKLVNQLDLAAKDSRRTVKVVALKNIDPALVQQAIDAIQGRRPIPTPGTTPGQGNGMPGFNGPGNNNGQRGGGGRDRPPPPRSYSGSQSRGPDFFGHGVTDDPQPSVFFDPQHRLDGSDKNDTQLVSSDTSTDIHLASLETQQPTTAAQPTPPAGGIPGPRGTVTIEALPQLDSVIINTNTPQDMEEILRIIAELQKIAAGAEMTVELMRLDYADATSVASTLTQLFSRVTINPGSSVRSTTPTQTTTMPGPVGPQTTTTQAAASVVLIPLPRFNGILVAAPKARLDDVRRELKRLDQPTSPLGRAVPFPLKKASATRVASLLTSFYSTRYSGETAALDQIRITAEPTINTVFVQAAPADLDEIRALIERIDTTVSSAVNELRIIPLRFGTADEISSLLLQAISQGVSPSAPTTGPVLTPGAAPVGAGAGLGGLGGAGLGGLGAGGGLRGLGAGAGLGGAPGLGGAATLGAPVPAAAPTTGIGGATTPTKSTTLRFVSGRPGGPPPVEAGILEDIHITPDERLNALIIAAPAKTMELLFTLIKELDVPPTGRAEIKVFPLRRADASATAIMLQQLFFGTTTGTGATTTLPGGAGGGFPGAPGGGLGFPGAPGGGGLLGAPGGFPGAAGGLGAGLGAQRVGAPTPGFPGAGGMPTAQFTVSGTNAQGLPLVPLHFTVDQRTNSLVVAGGRNDLDVIEAIVSRLEDSDVQAQRQEVFQLHNASAPDVATALQTFLTNTLQVISTAGQLTSLQVLERDVVIVPEPITNKLLISATPRFYTELVRLIQELDSLPPQVVIQVLVAEVDLTSSDEFGVEIGLQSPVLFSRSIIPTPAAIGPNGTIDYTSATGGLVQPGVTVNSSINPSALPGFNFNNPSVPLGNNPLVSPGVVGYQGLGSLGVGRTSPTSGVGGFVFSAASDTFNVLIRALRTQGRVDVISRPQIQTTDKQTAYINIGMSVPYVTGSSVASTGLVTNLINYRDVGVLMQVTPQITPDGTVLMRVIPEVSSVSPTQINLGNGQLATQFNVQHVETTVSARDGETVAIGGLITKHDSKTENKFPWLGDLPYIGALFRYRTQTRAKTELLFIMTPHIVRNPMEADRILAEEARKMDWVLGDVLKIQGTSGMAPIMPPPKGTPPGAGLPGDNAFLPGFSPEPTLLQAAPSGVLQTPSPTIAPAPATGEVLPQPRVVPGAQPTTPPRDVMPPAGPQNGIPPKPDIPQSSSTDGPILPPGDEWWGTSTQAAKEKRGWSLFHRDQ
jgi:type II secretory pathway component GspD/PulD (secretin)